MILEADLAVKRVHRLVLHLPAGVAALDQIDDARGIALVGVVIDRKRIPQRVEGDFLGVSQTGVENLEAAAIRLEAERRAFIRVIVAHALLGHEAQAAVADRPVDPPVRAEGESVQVMT